MNDLFQKMNVSITFKDVNGRESLKQILLGLQPVPGVDLAFHIQNTYLLLSGPAYCGKKFLAEAIAGEMERFGTVSFCLNKDQDKKHGVCEEKKTDSEIEADGHLDDHESLFSVYLLNDIDKVHPESYQAILNFFGRLDMEKNKEIVIATAENTEKLPWEFRRTFIECKIGLPDKKDRSMFLESKWPSSIPFGTETNIEKISLLTEGYNYKDMDNLIGIMKLLFKGYYLQLLGTAEGLDDMYQEHMVYFPEELFLKALELVPVHKQDCEKNKGDGQEAVERVKVKNNIQGFQQEAAISNKRNIQKTGEKVPYDIRFSDIFSASSSMNPENL